MNLKTTSKEFASPDNFGIVDPEMATVTEPRSVKSRTPRRTIGFFTASSIVIANIIGTGIFTSLGFQLADIQSGFPLLMLWIIGGIAALCGALCYGELSAALPRSGGEYHFLSQIYHPALGFMAGFISATVGFAAPIALAAMAFGKYFVGVFGVGSPVLLSFVVVWVVTVFHLRNLQIGSAFQNLWTTRETALDWHAHRSRIIRDRAKTSKLLFCRAAAIQRAIFSGAFAVALVYVMYSYSGWNASSLHHWRNEETGKKCPALVARWNGPCHCGLTFCSTPFFSRPPRIEEMRGQLEVGLIAGKHIFGTNGGRVAGAVICLGLVSAISSMTWIGPRVSMSMGEDHWLLRLLGRKNLSRHSHERHCAAVAHRECSFAYTQL